MFCTQCGSPTKVNHRFCGSCGTPLENDDVDEVNEADDNLSLTQEISLGLVPDDLISLDVSIENIEFHRTQGTEDTIVDVTISVSSNSSIERGQIKLSLFAFSPDGILIGLADDSFPVNSDSSQRTAVDLNVLLEDFNLSDYTAIQFAVSAIIIEFKQFSSSEIPLPTGNSTAQDFEFPDLPDEIEAISSGIVLQRHDNSDSSCIEARILLKNRGSRSPIVDIKGQIRLSTHSETPDDDFSSGITLCPGEICLLDLTTSSEVALEDDNHAIVYVQTEQVIAAGYANSLADFDSLSEPFAARHDPDSKQDSVSDEFYVRFAMTKGEGEWPDLDELSDEEVQSIGRIAEFVLDWVPDRVEPSLPDDLIVGAEIIYDGVSYSETCDCGLNVSDDEISGYPCPIIKFSLSKAISPEAFRQAVFTSSVSLFPESREADGGDAFFCEDYNGYTSILEKRELKELLGQLEEDGLLWNRDVTFDELKSGIKLLRD